MSITTGQVKRMDGVSEKLDEEDQVDKIIDDGDSPPIASSVTSATYPLSSFSAPITRLATRITTASTYKTPSAPSPAPPISSSSYSASNLTTKQSKNVEAMNPNSRKCSTESVSSSGGRSRTSRNMLPKTVHVDDNDVGDGSAQSGDSRADSAGNAKKGRAWVLQGMQAESTNLPQALAYYRHAATFVPDNSKLRDRIAAIEHAIATKTPLLGPLSSQYEYPTVPGRKVLKVKRRGESSVSASLRSSLISKSDKASVSSNPATRSTRVSASTSTTSSAPTSSNAEVESIKKKKSSNKIGSSSRKRKFAALDDEVDGPSAEPQHTSHHRSSSTSVDISRESPKKKRKKDKGKGKVRELDVWVISSESEVDRLRDEDEDPGEWEINESPNSNLDPRFSEESGLDGACGSGPSSSSASGPGFAVQSAPSPCCSRVVNSNPPSSSVPPLRHPPDPPRSRSLTPAAPRNSVSQVANSGSPLPSPLSPSLTIPCFVSALPNAPHVPIIASQESGFEFSDQVEEDEVAGALENEQDIDRGSSVEPMTNTLAKDERIKRRTITRSRASPQYALNQNPGNGLMKIQEEVQEEQEQEVELGVEPELTVEAVFERLMRSDDASSQWEDQTKDKDEQKKTHAMKNHSKSNSLPKSRAKAQASTGSATRTGRKHIPKSCETKENPTRNENNVSPPLDSSNQENVQSPTGSSLISTVQPSSQRKRKRYVYGSSDEEEGEVLVRDTAPGPVKKKRLNASTRKVLKLK
ncbi:hypothetical protein F5050DRAFT_86855 [Lentinula boryana]|uniref:Uncharacterized protein n=1 Tax=Lentinula boryana TaxID=40481 RepID=A0ABQ8QDC3_9AGAR|nr:hypothetical protein F5050DRAFT_86855 [Lentinula boryana]